MEKRELRECAECGRQMPRKSYKRRCATCVKIANGFEHVRIVERMPVPFAPGYINIIRSKWHKKAA